MTFFSFSFSHDIAFPCLHKSCLTFYLGEMYLQIAFLRNGNPDLWERTVVVSKLFEVKPSRLEEAVQPGWEKVLKT